MYTYTGATTNFTQRKATHKSTCNNANSKNYDLLLYQTIRAHGSWDNWEMVIVEIFPCETRQHLCVREQYHIEQQENKINSYRAFTTDDVYTAGRNAYKKLYNDLHRDEINAQSRKYKELHREEINAKMTKYREANREMINEQKKVYRQNDINTYKAREKAYREANKVIINEKQQATRLAKKREPQ